MDSPLHQNPVDVAIIGAGFSGTMAAIHLLRQTDHRITVGLVERTSQFARGLADRTRDATHRLNVPAAKMGAFPDDIGGFYRWLQSRPQRLRAVGVRTLHPNTFVPRMLFGEYLEDLLAEAETVAPRLQKTLLPFVQNPLLPPSLPPV
jgi:uncharacterized NAD(P)/FAD-binding protein YdhS